MARLTEYDERQAAGRLRAPITALRWAVHAHLVPRPDSTPTTWTRATVEAMDREMITGSIPAGPISGSQAAHQIAAAIGSPYILGEPCAVKVFTVSQFVRLGHLTDLSGHPEELLLHPGQVAEVCTRPDLAALVAAESPLGPDQAADRLLVRRTDWDHMVRLGWVAPAEWREVRFGTSRAGAVDVPLYRAVDVDALPDAHPEVDWEMLRSVGKGRRSPLASLTAAPAPV